MVLAGFIRPDSGEVRFGERDVSLVPPHKRDVGMVFQNYALFPHMTVAGNLAYPLKLRGVARAEHRGTRPTRPRHGAARRPRRPPGRPALGRPAAARGARPRHHLRAAHPADGRAALGTRQEAARADADRGAPPAPAARHDHGLRDARPARGADHVGPHRRHQPRPLPADRQAARHLRAAGQPLHRRVHRRIALSPGSRSETARPISAISASSLREPPRHHGAIAVSGAAPGES